MKIILFHSSPNAEMSACILWLQQANLKSLELFWPRATLWSTKPSFHHRTSWPSKLELFRSRTWIVLGPFAMFLPHTGEKRRERLILRIVGNACCQLSNQSFEGFLIMNIRSFERMANCLTHKPVHGSESTGHGFNQRLGAIAMTKTDC